MRSPATASVLITANAGDSAHGGRESHSPEAVRRRPADESGGPPGRRSGGLDSIRPGRVPENQGNIKSIVDRKRLK